MHPYPHTYVATATAEPSGSAPVESPGIAPLATAAPPQFDGPEGIWSPETLLTASLATCFILTFRAVSRAAHLDWRKLECRVESVLERIDGVSQFSQFRTFATLAIAGDGDVSKAEKLLEKAEHACLIANSMRGRRTLEARVVIEPHP